MQADLPHTLYNVKGREKPVKIDDECIRLNEEAVARARERHRRRMAGKDRPYTLDEVFSGAADND